MQISTQRWIDRYVGQVLCAGLSLWEQCKEFLSIAPQPAADPQNVRHVLVIMLSEMGSVVLAGPMFSAIKAQFPNAQLHLLQLAKNRPVAELLQLAPQSNLHVLDDSSLPTLLRSIVAFRAKMRALPLDVVVDCELFSRISAIMASISGAGLRAGFTPHTQEGLYRGSTFNRAIPYNPYRHISLQFVSLVKALFNSHAPRSKMAVVNAVPTDTGLKLDFSDEERKAYQAKLHTDHPVTQQRKLVLLYASGGILPARAWPSAYYAHVAQGLCAAGHAVGLIGLPEDSALAHSIIAEVKEPHCIALTGYTRNMRELLLLLHSADLLITNDGGPGHFASLTPIQTMMFFGPETAKLYGPLSPRATVFESGIACSPCLTAYNHRNTFCDGDNQCLKVIAPQPVLDMALHSLNNSLKATE
jgi:ADP-heptose:LPS heptosyltransferase